MTDLMTYARRFRTPRVDLDVALARDFARDGGELIPAGAGFRTREEAPDAVEDVTLPSVNWSAHRRAAVRVDLSGVIQGKRLLVSPIFRSELESNAPVRKNSLVEGRTHSAIVRRWGPQKTIPQGIFLGGFAPFAYFHHLCERLSRLSLLCELPSRYQTFPLLVPSRTLAISSLVEATYLLAPHQEIIPIERKHEYRIGELVWIDEIHRWSAGFSGAVTSRDGMTRFRHAILEALGVAPCVQRGVRLYLVRGPLRRSVNEEVLIREAEQFGFVPWRPEQHSFEEQVRTWSSAEAVVGDGGAAWSGALFAAEGSTGVVVTDGSAAGWPHFGRISGMDVHLLRLHRPQAGTEDGTGERGFFADPGSFREYLSRILSR